jgi:hypothetical protein
MPYAPGIQDISGQLIAQGMSQAGAARARALEGLGQSIAGGIKQYQQNQLFTQQSLAKFGSAMEDPNFKSYVQGIANDDPVASQVPEPIKKAIKNIQAGKADIYDAALVGSLGQDYQLNQFNRARTQAMQMDALKNRLDAVGRLQAMYEGGVELYDVVPDDLKAMFPKRQPGAAGTAEEDEIKGVPLDMTGAQPTVAEAPAAVAQFIPKIPTYRETTQPPPAAAAPAPAAPQAPIPMAAPRAAAAPAPTAVGEGAMALPPMPTEAGIAGPQRAVKTQYGIFSENVVNQANAEINRVKRTGQRVGAGERARILASFADQERKIRIEQSEFTDADTARRYAFNLGQSESKLPFGTRRAYNVKPTPRGTYAIESELSPMTPEEKMQQERGIEFGKVDANLLQDTVKADAANGELARDSAGAVTSLMQVLPNLKNETGRTGEIRLNIMSLGKALGFPVDEKKLSDLDYADALSNQLMFSWIQKSKGSSSDKETTLFRSISPGILKTGAANEQLLELLNSKLDLARNLERNASEWKQKTVSVPASQRDKINAEFYQKRQEILNAYDAKLPTIDEFRKRAGITDKQSVAESAAANAATSAALQADGRSAAQIMADAEAAAKPTKPGPVTKSGRFVRVNPPELTGPLVESDRPEYVQGLRRTR